MKFHIFVPGLLVLTAAVLAQSSHARGIQVDGTMTCTSVVPATGSLSVPLSGTGHQGNSAKAGVNFPVLACTDSVGPPTDTSLSDLRYDTKASVLYTWIDLSGANGSPSTLCLVPPLAAGCSQLAELAGFLDNPPNVPIIAMVDVLKLTHHHSGDYEIIFNYETFPEIACDNVFKPIAPSFSWFGKTYTFTGGPEGAITPCDSSATNDFLFGPNGVLLGYNSAPDNSASFVLTPGLPPGWTVN
jgi:hypothetical protein